MKKFVFCPCWDSVQELSEKTNHKTEVRVHRSVNTSLHARVQATKRPFSW